MNIIEFFSKLLEKHPPLVMDETKISYEECDCSEGAFMLPDQTAISCTYCDWSEENEANK